MEGIKTGAEVDQNIRRAERQTTVSQGKRTFSAGLWVDLLPKGLKTLLIVICTENDNLLLLAVLLLNSNT